MITGKRSLAMASGFIVVVAIFAAALGVPRPGSSAATAPVGPTSAALSPNQVGSSTIGLSVAEAVGTIAGAIASGSEQLAAPVIPGGPWANFKVHGRWIIEVREPDGSLAPAGASSRMRC